MIGRSHTRLFASAALLSAAGVANAANVRQTGISVLPANLVSAKGNANSATAPEQPFIAVAVRETFDAWTVPAGERPGISILNKLQISGTITGDQIGLKGWSAHAQVFRYDGQQLSAPMGDIQTADNLEAPPLTRLFEAWIAHRWGADNRSVALRAGLIDLNSQFDSIDPASLFINSSHGIGPDLSRSGRNGPSIYPVSAVGTTVTFVPSDRWTFRVGVFDGVPGDLDRPRAFLAERMKGEDGLLTITQADLQLTKTSRLEAGLWHYTARMEGVLSGRPHAAGAFVSYEAPVPVAPRVTGWARAGIADSRAQAVAGYIGIGAVQTGTFSGRPDDRLGVAVAHAIIGDAVVAVLGIHHAETSIEASYQAKLSERIAVQPDVQYIRHPAGVAKAPDALGVGLRVVLSTGFPKKPQATDSTDPTVPPDGAPTVAPADAAPPRP